MGKIKLRKQLTDTLHNQFRKGYGKPKHEMKDVHNSTPYIHSESTYKTYCQQVEYFVQWCYENDYKYKDEQMNGMVCQYIEHLKSEGKSAWTIQTALCAIAKSLNTPTTVYDVEIPKRERTSVKRSRYIVDRDKHVSVEHNQEVINFCKCCGLRARELKALTTERVYIESYRVLIEVPNGKGGKYRIVECYGTPTELKAIKRIVANREGLVFTHVHSSLDIHSFRAIYAQRVYDANARNPIPKEDRYVCRKDKAGIVYDKKALKICSQMLGHNRISVVAESYLYNKVS